MGPNVRRYSSAAVVARSIGFGFLGGAVLGVGGLVVASIPWAVRTLRFPSLPLLLLALYGAVIIALYAAAVGSVIGTLMGLWCGVVFVVAGRRATGDRRAVQRIAGVATGIPFLGFAVHASATDTPNSALAGWLLIVAAMAATTGAAIGPHVVGGGADPIAFRHCWVRHCRLRRSVRPA